MNALRNRDTRLFKPAFQRVEVVHNKGSVSDTGKLDRLIKQYITVVKHTSGIEDEIDTHTIRCLHLVGFVFIEAAHLAKSQLLIKRHGLLTVAYPNTDVIIMTNGLRLLHVYLLISAVVSPQYTPSYAFNKWRRSDMIIQLF